ncbi:hypothetical protein [Aporhodopirellula aestuarii]|uniref:SMI1/KNR4 family protein n=1 Tax=Aporhodopirellula aestuarii TaxID=2950107 RepID=A0ABT0U1E5_9BACT|nr:hypothetical protein [Aporhodopirellula aestuarii]MCM2370698.1 hypothetical protein [Aporhodopirellula aestuarii]
MLDDRTDLDGLRSGIEKITEQWFGHRGPWMGISAEKLSGTRMPDPLKWIYHFAGEWPSSSWWESVFAYQDRLLPFESLEVCEGKLVFVIENQGCWMIGTLTEGSDPPVWVRENEDGAPWRKLGDSLTEFLVTFCLHEIVFGARYRTHVDNILDRFRELGCHVSPLWINSPYVYLFDDQATRPISFHMVDGKFLVMDDGWCGTSVETPWERFPDLFQKPDESPRRIQGHEPFPDDMDIPDFVRKSHIETLIRRHQMQADYHQDMILKYSLMIEQLR